eukprot:10899912-Alexandrium_andersonii.AAC.1
MTFDRVSAHRPSIRSAAIRLLGLGAFLPLGESALGTLVPRVHSVRLFAVSGLFAVSLGTLVPRVHGVRLFIVSGLMVASGLFAAVSGLFGA